MSTEPLPRFRHRFADAGLLELALTHRSAGRRNNERLEFLGDAVIGLLVSEHLYQRFGDWSEGDLTRLRSSLVREASLAAMARELRLGDALRLGPGELRSGGHNRDSILADGLEALFGAVFLDAGFDACRTALAPLLAPRLADPGVGRPPKDPKTELQELLQGRGQGLPLYELIGSEGDEHAKVFHARCRVDALALNATGSGNSRRAAETAAAQRLLEQLRAAG